MKTLIGVIRALGGVVLLAACTETPTEPEPDWVHEGQWRPGGSIAVAPDNSVYVTGLHHIQHFTATGSYLGQWEKYGSGCDVAVGANGYVYVTSDHRIRYYTTTGSYLGQWGEFGTGNGEFQYPSGVAVADNGNVYVVDSANDRIQYFTSTGSYLGRWGSPGSGDGQFNFYYRWKGDVAVASGGNVYVADCYNHRIQFFTATGSFLGNWGHFGSSDSNVASGVAVLPTGAVFVTYYRADMFHDEEAGVDYFTATGSFLGRFGSHGKGEGQFLWPGSIAISPSGPRVYVDDSVRIQYFRRK